jgi:chromosome transmission fidelity protein 18
MVYPQLSYPTKGFEAAQKIATTKLIFNSLKKGISSNLRGIGCGSEVLLDSTSLIKLIISPEIRSVSMHLLTAKEKVELKHTVDIITDLGLTFNQMQSPDGTYIYRIEPDIEHLGASFTDALNSRQMSYWSKQTIAQEVELEKMRRAKPKVSEIENVQVAKAKETATTALPNHLQRLIPKAIKPVAKAAQVVSFVTFFAC